MFSNYISVHDILDIIVKLKEIGFNQGLLKATSGKERVKNSWKHTSYLTKNWWDIPDVNERWNYLITGDVNVDARDWFSQKYLYDKNHLQALSLGCGTGKKELYWAGSGKFTRIDAYDLSDKRIEFARSEAIKKNLQGCINFQVRDIYTVAITQNHYDLVISEMSMHHFSPLKELLHRINESLNPEGYLYINEFVGPTRFQWTDRQLEVMNGLLSLLPQKYKVKSNGYIKSKIYRPSKLSMILSDPSEAVESSKILPLLSQIFDVVEIREYGGNILQMLLSDIAQNFMSDDDDAQRVLRLCFEVEDILLKTRDIQSDFVVAICKRRA